MQSALRGHLTTSYMYRNNSTRHQFLNSLPAYQFSLGQTTLEALAEHVSRQLHGQRTYFLSGGGGAIGWRRGREYVHVSVRVSECECECVCVHVCARVRVCV